MQMQAEQYAQPVFDTETVPKDRPRLGEKVIATAVAERTYQQEDGKATIEVHWVRKAIEPVKGVYIGHRFKRSGLYNFSAYSGGGHLTPIGGMSVALVVTGERRAPIQVPWDCLKWGND